MMTLNRRSRRIMAFQCPIPLCSARCFAPKGAARSPEHRGLIPARSSGGDQRRGDARRSHPEPGRSVGGDRRPAIQGAPGRRRAEGRGLPPHWIADQAALAFEKVRLLEQEREAVRRLRRNEQNIRHLAYHDALTGLPNGRAFRRRSSPAWHAPGRMGANWPCSSATSTASRTSMTVWGTAQGDELLKAASDRLTDLCSRHRHAGPTRR